LDKLLKILDNLGTPSLLVVGGFMVDRYVWGDVERISPEAPVPVLRVKREEDRLGGAGRVLHDLATLHARTHAVGVVGNDASGKYFRGALKRLKIDCDGLVSQDGHPTTLKVRLVARVQHVYRVDYQSDGPYSATVEERLLRHVERKLPLVKAVLISDYHSCLPATRTIQEMLRLARKAGVPALVDPARGADYRRYRRASVITPNRSEAASASGIAIHGLADAKAAARKLLCQLELDAVVVTLDKDGLLVVPRKGDPEHLPTRPRAVYDVTGAGDMVLALLGLAMAGGAGLREAAALANVAAGIEVEKMGAVPVTLNEIRSELADPEQAAVSKIKTPQEMIPILDEHRRRGETIAFTNGCFDLIHAGHISYLRFSRAQGDLLVAGLNSDRSVRALKGKDRPIQSQKERALILASLADVSYVVIFDEKTPLRLIKRLKPDVLIKGADWRDKGVVGAEFVEERGGKVVFAPYLDGLSTTDMIGRVLEKYGSKTRKG
jgi:D-beta-D-heptose 7-phosphate kinase/D-beta-D-heptose 1-phosphate adenosyltransferase